jgi:hypothetical protein
VNTALALALIELILKYGPSVAISLVRAMKVENPTPEDIRALKVDDPETYFDVEKGGD